MLHLSTGIRDILTGLFAQPLRDRDLTLNSCGTGSLSVSLSRDSLVFIIPEATNLAAPNYTLAPQNL